MGWGTIAYLGGGRGKKWKGKGGEGGRRKKEERERKKEKTSMERMKHATGQSSCAYPQ